MKSTVLLLTSLMFLLFAAHNTWADSALFQQAREQLALSQQLLEAASQDLIAANQQRKTLLDARRKNSSNAPIDSQSSSTATLLATESATAVEKLQQQAAQKRAQAALNNSAAIENFAKALQQRYPQLLQSQAQFTASLVDDAKQTLATTAHNSIARSVHPNMPPALSAATTSTSVSTSVSTSGPTSVPTSVPTSGPTSGPTSIPTSAPTTNANDIATGSEMTLAVSTATATNNMEIARNTTAVSSNALWLGNIQALPLGSNHIAINALHRWQLIVTNLQGEPVTQATIEFAGHMPGHIHGLPTQPQITEEIAPGVYEVAGVKFQMLGWWVIDFHIEHQGQRDSVRFNLVL